METQAYLALIKLLVTCFAVFFASVFALVVIRYRKKNPYAWTSSLFSIIILLLSTFATIYLDLLPNFYWELLFNWTLWCLIFLFIRSAIRFKRYGKEGEKTSALKSSGDSDDLDERNEKFRKLFHMSGFLLVLAYFGIVPLVVPVLDFFQEFPSTKEAINSITLFSLIAATFFVAAIDTQRILFGEEYGFRRMNFLLREKEIRSPGAQTYLILGATGGWVIGMLFEPANGPIAIQIPLVAVLISTFADGMAAIVGKAKGKHKVKRPFNQVKTVEGFFSGFITALGISLISLAWFPNGWILSIISALIFLLVDYVSLPIADNVLNPVAITLILELINRSL